MYSQKFPIRFNDVDYAQMVYFPNFFSYCHKTFEDFFPAELGKTYFQVMQELEVGFPAVHAESDYVSPLRFGDTCRIELEVTRLGTKSVTCRYRLYIDDTDKLAAVMSITGASVSMKTFRSVEIPIVLRGLFERHLKTENEGGSGR